jgi:hypothetical protein
MDVVRMLIVAPVVSVMCASSFGALRAHAGQSPAGAKTGGLRACTLLTKDEIKKATAPRIPRTIDRFEPDEELLPGGGSECTIGDIDVQLDAVSVSRFEERLKTFAATTKFERIDGVGDAAYFYEQGTPGTPTHIVGVYARAGQHVVVYARSVAAPETTQTVRPGLIALATAAAAKLR